MTSWWPVAGGATRAQVLPAAASAAAVAPPPMSSPPMHAQQPSGSSSGAWPAGRVEQQRSMQQRASDHAERLERVLLRTLQPQAAHQLALAPQRRSLGDDGGDGGDGGEDSCAALVQRQVLEQMLLQRVQDQQALQQCDPTNPQQGGRTAGLAHA